MTATPPPLTDQQLAERIAEVIRPRMLIGLQDAELYDGPGTERINEWATSIANWAAEVMRPELDRLSAERDQARAELALATVFEIPRPGNAAPLQIRQIYDDTDRWAICDRTGRRRGRDGGWWYEPEREELCDSTRFTLAEALPLAQQLAQDDKAARTVPDAP
jgi:hypothetical protein